MKKQFATPPLDLIKTFVTYCEYSNIVQAAKDLGLSQGAITGHLQKLETYLPAKAFLTTGRRKILTPYGKVLFESLQEDLSNINRTIERVNQHFSDESKLNIRIGCRRELIQRIATKFSFPGRIIFLPMTHEEMMAALKDRTVDVIVTHLKPDSNELIARKIFTEGAKIITPTTYLTKIGWNHREIKTQDVTSRTFLQSFPCIVYKKTAPLLKSVLDSAGISLGDLNIKAICEDWMGIVKLVEAEAGYSIIPEDIAVEKKAAIFQLTLPASIIEPMTFYATFPKDLLAIKAYATALNF